MIISLRGTSGSGKSHLLRRIVALYEKHRAVYEEGRKKPLYEIHGRNAAGRTLVTPGHYLIANGGVDTLPSLDKAYEIARWAARCGHDVLMEGKNMSDGLHHVQELQRDGYDVRVVHVRIPVDACMKSIRERGHKISEASVVKTNAKVLRDFAKFTCIKVAADREGCYDTVKRWLGPHEEAKDG